MAEIDEFFEQSQKQREQQFGIEAQLNQLLWDCQMSEDYHQEAFDTLIVFMQEIVKEQKNVEKLLEIKIDREKI